MGDERIHIVNAQGQMVERIRSGIARGFVIAFQQLEYGANALHPRHFEWFIAFHCVRLEQQPATEDILVECNRLLDIAAVHAYMLAIQFHASLRFAIVLDALPSIETFGVQS
jgi:hypothetical protein